MGFDERTVFRLLLHATMGSATLAAGFGGLALVHPGLVPEGLVPAMWTVATVGATSLIEFIKRR